MTKSSFTCFLGHFMILRVVKNLRFRPKLRFKFIRRGLDCLDWLNLTKMVVAKSRHTVKFFKLNNFKILDIFWISKKISILPHFEIFTVQFHPCPGCLKEIMDSGTKIRSRKIQVRKRYFRQKCQVICGFGQKNLFSKFYFTPKTNIFKRTCEWNIACSF